MGPVKKIGLEREKKKGFVWEVNICVGMKWHVFSDNYWPAGLESGIETRDLFISEEMSDEYDASAGFFVT